MKNLQKILEANKAKKGDDNKSGREDKVPAGGKTLTGQQHNEIDTTPIIEPLKEETGKHAVVTFGRMNPPTTGHEKLVNHVKALAKKHGAETHVFLSHSHDSKKNPLSYEHKHALAKEAFGDVVKHVPKEHAHMLGVAKHMNGKADHLHMVVGSDRVDEVKKKLHAYNGKEYHFKSITVHSAGARDPDSDGVSGMSASKMRAHAAAGEHEHFKSGLPKAIQHKSKEIMNAVKPAVKEELEESLNAQQRMKRAIQFKRIQARVKMGRQRAMRRRAPKNVLVKRARRLAIKFMRNRIIRGQNYKDMPYGTRAMVDARLKKRKKSVGRIAQRLLPRVARAEASRKLGGRFVGVSKLSGPVTEENLLEFVNEITQNIQQEYDYELTESEIRSLTEKAVDAELPVEMIESVFRRGLYAWQLDEETQLSFQEYAFNRVNSFLSGGMALALDADLFEDYEADKYEVPSVQHGRPPKDSVEHRTSQKPPKPKKIQVIRKIIEQNKLTPAQKLHNRLNKLDPKREQRHKEIAALVNKYKQKPVNEAELEGEMRRIDMPQIVDFDKFKEDLYANQHGMHEEKRNAGELQPLQKHFNQEKVDRMIADGKHTDKAIIISKDDYIIDGHHRWKACHQAGCRVKTKKLSMTAAEAMDFLKDKPYVENKKLHEATKATSDALEQAFADMFLVYFKAHSAHWNVVGSDFAQAHEMFEGIYSDLWKGLDEVAELQRTLNDTAAINLPALVNRSTADKTLTGKNFKDMAKEVYDANEVSLNSLRAAYKAAEKEGQLGVSNVLQDRITAQEKHGWMLRATFSSQ